MVSEFRVPFLADCFPTRNSEPAHDQPQPGKPQIYGTQFRQVEGIWILDQIDEKAVTDEERAKWHVPPLADSKKRAEQMNRKK